jgi:hypothetical protein
MGERSRRRRRQRPVPANESARDIRAATRDYERWVRRYTPLLAFDLRLKHQRMRASPWSFFRATYYRWAEHARRWRRDERRPATTVLGIGDLHVENFGTWRDAEGRLIWGINDFDESCRLPWTEDLVRLLASVFVAIQTDHLGVGRRPAAQAVWSGYRDGLRAGGRPFVLESDNDWLRVIALSAAREPAAFWKRLTDLRTAGAAQARPVAPLLLRPPLSARAGARIVRRIAGMGSLGRPRLVGLGEWAGGLVAREAKALVPSAHHWAVGDAPSLRQAAAAYRQVVAVTVRAPDPFFEVGERWIVRRLAPHCTRVELADLPAVRDELRLLHAFGVETANVHLGTPGARARILRELRRFDAGWLRRAAKRAAAAILEDWRAWRDHGA